MNDELKADGWALETMRIINRMTPDIKGKAFDVDWFLLRQRFEEIEYALRTAQAAARKEGEM
jgi:hypothetical protein